MYWMCQRRNPPRGNEGHFFATYGCCHHVEEERAAIFYSASETIEGERVGGEGMQGGQVEGWKGWKEEGSKHFPPPTAVVHTAIAKQTKADTECSFFSPTLLSPFPFPSPLTSLARSNHFRRLLLFLLLPGKSFYYTLYPPLPHYIPLSPNWREGEKTNCALTGQNLPSRRIFGAKVKKNLFLPFSPPFFVLESKVRTG